jgi:LysM repeat protein
MERRPSSAARIAAVLALIGAVIVIAIVASTALNGSDNNSSHHKQHQAQQEKKNPRTKAKTYTVETGDTLTAIAHKTGVPVAEILALNPEVDPQILIAGQTLKLK